MNHISEVLSIADPAPRGISLARAPHLNSGASVNSGGGAEWWPGVLLLPCKQATPCPGVHPLGVFSVRERPGLQIGQEVR